MLTLVNNLNGILFISFVRHAHTSEVQKILTLLLCLYLQLAFTLSLKPTISMRRYDPFTILIHCVEDT